jgi:hypothetical protein
MLTSTRLYRSSNLCPASPTNRRDLAAALAAAIAEEPEIGRGGHSIAIPDNNGGGVIATILPLERRVPQSLLHSVSAIAAIFVQDPAVLPLLPGDAFGKLYGLTGGELRVALKVASGLAPQENLLQFWLCPWSSSK